MDFKNSIEELDTSEIINSQYINWDFYTNSTILVTGATGLIGTQAVKTLLYANEKLNTNIKIIALVRNFDKAIKIFGNKKSLEFCVQDITSKIIFDKNIDFIIHTANGTSSKEFVEKPVETIESIVSGTRNILEFAKSKQVKSLVYLSSMEVYGQTDFNKEEPLKENEYGYIDILTPRSSYPEGKRLAETLCVAYATEYNTPVKISRLVQTLGANVDYNDNRVFAQFARNIAEKKDITLHTKGETVRAYCYITDVITALMVILERGANGECYNISNSSSACSIKEMAENLCKRYNTSSLKIDLTNENNKFYLPKTKTILDSSKLKALNWKPLVDIDQMYDRLISNFRLISKGDSVEK